MIRDAGAPGTASAGFAVSVRPTWRAAMAAEVALGFGCVLAAAGILLSRVDLVLLALPLLLCAAIDRDASPSFTDESRLRISVTRDARPDAIDEVAFTLGVDAPTGSELVHLRLTLLGGRTHHLILGPNARVTGRLLVLHSGPQRVVAVDYRLVSVGGAWLSLPVQRELAEQVVPPAILPLGSLPLPHRLTGLMGTHGSARPGDGGEFRDLHAFGAGDRLRRIDWKSTARRSQGVGELYVRRTDATSDATVVIVIDSREDVGEVVVRWSASPSDEDGLRAMDLAREAAASLAAAAIGAGDRVGLLDLAAPLGLVRAGSGKRHLDRLLRRIAECEPAGTPFSRRRAPIVPAGAVVYLLSTFLDDEASSVAMLWRASGHRVLAVDVLPALRLDRCEHNTRLAHRLVMAERRHRVTGMQANGVELFRWQEDENQPSRAVAVRSLARARRSRR